LQAPSRSAQSESAALAAAVSSQDDRPGTAGCVHYGCSHCGLPKPLKLLRLCSACNQAMYARSNGDRARLMNLAPQHVLACAAQPRRLPQYGPTAPAHSRPSRRYCSVECQRMHWFHGDHARKCSHENPASAASTDAQRDHYTAAKAELLRVPAAAPAKVAASTAAVPPHQARDGHDQPLSLPHMQQVHVEREVRTAPGPRQAVTAPHRCCLALCTCARLAVYSCPTPSLLKTAVVIAFGIDFHARMYLRSAARSTTADYNHSGSRQMGAS
jgi:hypothetical protein